MYVLKSLMTRPVNVVVRLPMMPLSSGSRAYTTLTLRAGMTPQVVEVNDSIARLERMGFLQVHESQEEHRGMAESRKKFEKRMTETYLQTNTRYVSQLTSDGLPELPPMSEAELQELERDIKENGIRQPLLSDRCNLIDGRVRLAIARKLGIGKVYVNDVGITTLEERQRMAIEVNALRRHMTPERRRQMVLDYLKAEPDDRPRESTRSVAGKMGVSPMTVSRLRQELKAGVSIDTPEATRGKDGKTYKQKPKGNTPVPQIIQEPVRQEPEIVEGPTYFYKARWYANYGDYYFTTIEIIKKTETHYHFYHINKSLGEQFCLIDYMEYFPTKEQALVPFRRKLGEAIQEQERKLKEAQRDLSRMNRMLVKVNSPRATEANVDTRNKRS